MRWRIDRPYRIGDRIDLSALETWGNVVDISLCFTRVLTLNHRMVILPNSKIGNDEIVNNSYPDETYYDTLNVVVSYDNDIEQVGKLLFETVKSVEGVLKVEESDVVLMNLSEYAVVFQVGWWLRTYEDYFIVRDRTNRAIIKALNGARVILPYTRGRLRLNGSDGRNLGLKPVVNDRMNLDFENEDL
jgi:small conductance mechanosensitive channel